MDVSGNSNQFCIVFMRPNDDVESANWFGTPIVHFLEAANWSACDVWKVPNEDNNMTATSLIAFVNKRESESACGTVNYFLCTSKQPPKEYVIGYSKLIMLGQSTALCGQDFPVFYSNCAPFRDYLSRSFSSQPSHRLSSAGVKIFVHLLSTFFPPVTYSYIKQ